MANNLKPVKAIFNFCTWALILAHAQGLSAQISAIDTSDYIPLFYNGALEYNLMTASYKGYAGEVKRIIAMGAEVNAQTNEGITPLIFAISNFRLGVIDILLANNADPNQVTANQESPLFISIKNLNSQLAYQFRREGINVDSLGILIAEKLIKDGAEIDFQDRNGTTALNYASIHGFRSTADMLLYYGADIDKKSWDGTTPLMSAIWAGYADVADLLIQNGANLEARDASGYTPFLIAAQNGDTLIFRMLIDQGVNIYEKANNNWDALDIAIRSGQSDAVRWLLKNGDKWNDVGKNSVPYANVAANYRRKEIFSILKNSNLPAEYKFHFNQMDISVSEKLAFWDNYTCFSLGIKEPRNNFGIFAGFDTKLWYTRILLKTDQSVYYQYYDKSSLAWAGIYKDFTITDYLFRNNLSVSCSLTGGYFFGNKYKGSDKGPESKFKLSPGLAFKMERKNRVLFTGVELMTTGYSRMLPVWLRIGYSRKFSFDFSKSDGKNIKWY